MRMQRGVPSRHAAAHHAVHGTQGLVTAEYSAHPDRKPVHFLPWARSYKKLPEHVKVGSQILCADGSFVLEVLETDAKAGTVRAKAMNNATLG